MEIVERLKKMLEEAVELQKKKQQKMDDESKESTTTVEVEEEAPEGSDIYDGMVNAARKFLGENKKRTVILLANDEKKPQSLQLIAGGGVNIVHILTQLAKSEAGPLFDMAAKIKEEMSKETKPDINEDLESLEALIKTLKELQKIKL